MSISLYTSPSEVTVKHSLNNVTAAISKLWSRIQLSEFAVYGFELNKKIHPYHFDFYSADLNLAIQIDAYSYCYEETHNYDQMKLVEVASKGVKVLKVSDYQVLIDADEIIRFLKKKALLPMSSALSA